MFFIIKCQVSWQAQSDSNDSPLPLGRVHAAAHNIPMFLKETYVSFETFDTGYKRRRPRTAVFGSTFGTCQVI